MNAHVSVLDRFRAYLDGEDYSPKTRRAYYDAVAAFCAWFAERNNEPFTPQRLTAIDLVAYRTRLQQTRAVSTVNVAVNALARFGAWLVESGELKKNPAQRLKTLPASPTLAPKALTAPQVNALLREAQQTRHPARDYALIQVLVQTGLRISECAALRVADVVIGERSGQVTVRSGKGRKRRIVPLNASARQALADYLAPRFDCTALPATVGLALRQQPDGSPIWLSDRQRGRAGAPILGVRQMSRIIEQLVTFCAARSLVPEDTSPHTLRHTFATSYLADHPGDLVGLAALLGHDSIETTKIYVQPSQAELDRRVEATSLNAFG